MLFATGPCGQAPTEEGAVTQISMLSCRYGKTATLSIFAKLAQPDLCEFKATQPLLNKLPATADSDSDTAIERRSSVQSTRLWGSCPPRPKSTAVAYRGVPLSGQKRLIS